MNNFSIQIDIYQNKFNIHLLNKKYEDKKLTLILKNDDNVIHHSIFSVSIEYFYYFMIDLTTMNNVKIEIYDNEELLQTESFKFKYKNGNIKMPAIRIYNPMGFGDYMMITPIMKKLHSIYNQKVSVILPNINSAHNNKTNEHFKEFIISNPDLNILFNWGNFSDPENRYEVFMFLIMIGMHIIILI